MPPVGYLLWLLLQPTSGRACLHRARCGVPGLLVQDSWRSRSSPRAAVRAFANDMVWTVLMVGALVAAYAAGTSSVVLALLIFGGTATLAGIVGLVQARILPRPSQTRFWIGHNAHLGPRYLIENLSNSAGSQLRAVVLGAAAGLAAVGQVRGAEMLLGPFLVILFGVVQVVVPEARRAMRRGTAQLSRFCVVVGLALAAACLTWGLAILLVFPLGLGELLLRTRLALRPDAIAGSDPLGPPGQLFGWGCIRSEGTRAGRAESSRATDRHDDLPDRGRWRGDPMGSERGSLGCGSGWRYWGRCVVVEPPTWSSGGTARVSADLAAGREVCASGGGGRNSCQ